MLAYLASHFCHRPTVQNGRLAPCWRIWKTVSCSTSAYGGTWVYGSRITYSFMPDGTSVGGTPSALFQTLNAKFPTATWELQSRRPRPFWQAVANINLAQVSDIRQPGRPQRHQPDDPRFGDIRIGAVWAGRVLGETFLPPPFNGGTDAGDMFLNSNPIAI